MDLNVGDAECESLTDMIFDFLNTQGLLPVHHYSEDEFGNYTGYWESQGVKEALVSAELYHRCRTARIAPIKHMSKPVQDEIDRGELFGAGMVYRIDATIPANTIRFVANHGEKK